MIVARNERCTPTDMDPEIYLQTRAAKTMTDAYAVETIRARHEKYGRYVRRLNVRFDEAINARGRIDKVCRIHVSLRAVPGIPSLIVEGRAPHEREAAALAAEEVRGAIDDRVGRPRPPPIEEPVVIVESRYAERDGATPRELKTARPARKRHIHKTQRQARATAARESTAPGTRPSRKLTRKSANRIKRDSQQTLAADRRNRAPEARASRAVG